MADRWHVRAGGRKFLIANYAITWVSVLALNGADAVAYGTIGLIVGAFVGGNSFVEGKHAGKPDA